MLADLIEATLHHSHRRGGWKIQQPVARSHLPR